GRLLPEEIHVADPWWSVNEVERSVAEHLVGDVHAGALGVAGLGRHEDNRLPRAPVFNGAVISTRRPRSTVARRIQLEDDKGVLFFARAPFLVLSDDLGF